jgi:hypothetical protein
LACCSLRLSSLRLSSLRASRLASSSALLRASSSALVVVEGVELIFDLVQAEKEKITSAIKARAKIVQCCRIVWFSFFTAFQKNVSKNGRLE